MLYQWRNLNESKSFFIRCKNNTGCLSVTPIYLIKGTQQIYSLCTSCQEILLIFPSIVENYIFTLFETYKFRKPNYIALPIVHAL